MFECNPSVPPSVDCDFSAIPQFTRRDLVSPVPVSTYQQIDVTVNISFS